MFFTKGLHSQTAGFFQFYFNKFYSSKGIRFHVYFSTPNNKLYEHSGGWKIIQTNEVPDWVMGFEPELSSAIAAYTVASVQQGAEHVA
jgi:hypothetical protein